MQVFYDLALGLFLQSPGSNNEITQLTAKRATNNPISLQFLNNGTPVTLPTGTQFTFGAKQSNNGNGGYYDANYVVYVDNIGWSGPDENGFYNATPGYNTVPLNALFGYVYPNIDNLPHPDNIILEAEITWLKPEDALPSKTPYWTLLCYNDVSKGIEGVPTSGGPVYPSPSAIELIANKGVAGGYCPLGSNTLVPISFLPIATGTSLGIMQVGTGLTVIGGVVSSSSATFATGTSFGIVQIGTGLSVLGGVISVPIATGSSLGVVKIGTGLAIIGGVLSTSGATLPTALFSVAQETLTVAGSETLTIPATCRLFTYQIEAQAGSGAYTWAINLSATNRVAGDKLCLVLAMDATGNPTVNVNNIAATTIFSLSGNASLAFKYQAWFTYDGTDWTLDE